MKASVTFGYVAFGLFVVLMTLVYLTHLDKRRKQREMSASKTDIGREWPESSKVTAVAELRKKLDESLEIVSQRRSGVKALREAQAVAERVFYHWLNDHYPQFQHLLCSGCGTIQITGWKNGEFTYSLPTDLNRYTKGIRK